MSQGNDPAPAPNDVGASAEMPAHYLQNVIRDSTDDFMVDEGGREFM